MDGEKKEEAVAQTGAWEKFRAFVKRNKTKIIAGFAAIVGWIAGDSGVCDAIRVALFGA